MLFRRQFSCLSRKSYFTTSRRFCKEPKQQAAGTPVTTETTTTKKAPHGLFGLIREYGVPLAIYYFVLNETCVVGITAGLHYGWFGGADIVRVLDYVGAGSYVDLDKMNHHISFGPFSVSAKLATNFGLATAFMSLWTPVQLPFCIATLPYIKRAVRFSK
eukprot:PhM_4_TR15663/c1_g1_i3/m.21255